MRNKFIGFDTSNYTTSVGMLTGAMSYINQKKLLPVVNGDKGLRQSDAVFLHVKALPDLMQGLDISSPTAIGVSTRPRSIDGSYMPCFLPGILAAKTMASASGVSLYEFSHQQGHIAAALLSSGKEDLLHKPFFAYHLSGGTMELLKVNSIESIEIISKTLDITAGQLIDRVGVSLGLSFPCGAELEKIALTGEYTNKIKVSKKGNDICLSGYENIADKMIKEGADKHTAACFVQKAVFENIKAVVKDAVIIYGNMPFVFVGGVMSNSFLKDSVKDLCDAYFAEPSLSSDNAVGIAYLTKLRYEGKI